MLTCCSCVHHDDVWCIISRTMLMHHRCDLPAAVHAASPSGKQSSLHDPARGGVLAEDGTPEQVNGMPLKNNRPVAFQERLDLAPFMAPGQPPAAYRTESSGAHGSILCVVGRSLPCSGLGKCAPTQQEHTRGQTRCTSCDAGRHDGSAGVSRGLRLACMLTCGRRAGQLPRGL